MRVNAEDIALGCCVGRCDTCGGSTLPHGVFWFGEPGVEICNRCALLIPPSLIADSLPRADVAHVEAALQQITTRVWRAAFIRLDRERKPKLQPSEKEPWKKKSRVTCSTT